MAASCWDSSDGPSIWSSLYPIAVKIFLALILIKTSFLVFVLDVKISLKHPLSHFKLFQRYLSVRVFFNFWSLFTLRKNTVISPKFLVWKVCGKAQFPHGFRRIARNYAETVPFHKIRWNYGIFRGVNIKKCHPKVTSSLKAFSKHW